MPRRFTFPRAAYHFPDRHWTRSEFWSTRFENDVPRLTLSALWQIAPLDDEVRAFVQTRDRFIAWEIRHTRQGDIIALFWCPVGLQRKETYTALRGEGGRLPVQFTPYDHQVCVTAERVWTCGGGDRTHESIGMLVHALDNTWWGGEPGFDFYRRPFPDEVVLSHEDAEALRELGA